MEGLKCSFCGRKRRAVRELVMGPNVYICDSCAASLIKQGRKMGIDHLITGDHEAARGLPITPLSEPRTDDTCSFCGRQQGETRHLFRSPSTDARICDQCLGLCDEILEMQLAPDWFVTAV